MREVSSVIFQTFRKAHFMSTYCKSSCRMFKIFPKVKETRTGKWQHFVKFTAIYLKYYIAVYCRGCYLAAPSNLALQSYFADTVFLINCN